MRKHSPFVGIVIMISAMAFFTMKDGFAKVIVADMTPLQLIWIQFTFTTLLLGLVTWPQHRWRAFMPTPFIPQLLRGLAAVGGVGSFYWALSYKIPLADASAMILIAPLVVTALSPFILGEKIGPRRIIAVVIGFAGVLLILRPGFRGELIGYSIAMMTGLLYGFNYIGNRFVGRKHPPLINVAHSTLFGAVLLTPFMPLVWVNPLAVEGFNLGVFLIISLIGHSLMVTAFRFGDASVLAPYQYSVIVFATIIGYYFFGDFPDNYTWAGIALIIASGIFIAMREGQLSKPAPEGKE